MVPWDAETQPGDSGGPLYAFVDPDGAGPLEPIAKLLSAKPSYTNHSLIYTWEFYNNFITDTVAAFPNGPVVTMANGVGLLSYFTTLGRFGAMSQHSSWDLAGKPVPYGCALSLTENPADPIDYAGCRFISPSTGEERACSTQNLNKRNEWQCETIIPRGHMPDWELSKIFAVTESGDYEEVDTSVVEATLPFDSLLTGQSFLTNPNPDQTPPTFNNVVSSGFVAPGEDLFCALHHTGVKASCSYWFGGQGFGGSKNSGGISTTKVSVPSSVPSGQTVSIGYSVSVDEAGNRSYDSVPPFETVECSTITPTISPSSGWESAPIDNLGNNGWGEFYVRPTVSNQDASVVISGTAVTDEANARAGVRFNSSGVVDVLSEGAWETQAVYQYLPNVWYKVMLSTVTTAGRQWGTPGGDLSQSNKYDAWIAPCGGKITRLGTDIPQPPTRNYVGIETVSVYSSQAAPLDIAHISPQQVYCFPANCDLVWEPMECGFNVPDGCGGTIPTCGVGACTDFGNSFCNEDYQCDCTPSTCVSTGYECGTHADGCGGPTFECGDPGGVCPAGGTCEPDFSCTP